MSIKVDSSRTAAQSSAVSKRLALLDEDLQIWIDWLVRDGQIEVGQVAPKDIYTNQFQPRPLAEVSEKR
jgi:hypothetical protein